MVIRRGASASSIAETNWRGSSGICAAVLAVADQNLCRSANSPKEGRSSTKRRTTLGFSKNAGEEFNARNGHGLRGRLNIPRKGDQLIHHAPVERCSSFHKVTSFTANGVHRAGRYRHMPPGMNQSVDRIAHDRRHQSKVKRNNPAARNASPYVISDRSFDAAVQARSRTVRNPRDTGNQQNLSRSADLAGQRARSDQRVACSWHPDPAEVAKPKSVPNTARMSIRDPAQPQTRSPKDRENAERMVRERPLL